MLDIRISDLKTGANVARLRNFKDAEVEIPLNDSRLAKVTTYIDEAAATAVQEIGHNRVGERCLKIRWGDRLLFHGVIASSEWDGEEGTVTFNGHDPSLVLKRRFLVKGDSPVKDGYTISGLGMSEIIDAGFLLPSQLSRGIPDIGIVLGQDYSDPSLALSAPLRKADRGAVIWDELLSTSNAHDGPDFELLPIDDIFDPLSVWAPGVMCEFNTPNYDPLDPTPVGYKQESGKDKSEMIVFHYGFGANNLQNFRQSPDLTEMANYSVIQRDEILSKWKAESSWETFGIYGEWNSADSQDSDAAMDARAKAHIEAKGIPPHHFEIFPSSSSGNEPQRYEYWTHFIVGDLIRAIARKQNLMSDLIGRITKVTISQDDSALGGVGQKLECAPFQVASPAAEIEGT